MNRFAHISFLFFFFLINNLSVQANPRSFECHLSLEVTAEPGSNLLPPPLFSGPDSVCLGATYTYNSASIPTATYFWVASGGTIISGTSSPSCQVIWNMLPGQLTLYRTLSSNTIFETLPVAASAFPPLNLGPDLTLCTGDSVILDAGPGYTSYLWSSGGTNQKDTLITAGLFSVIVQGCTNQTAYDTILITSIPIIQPNLGPDTAICAGTSIQLSGSTPGINVFIWSNGAITPTITTNIPATYSLITQDSNGCQGRDTLVLNNYPTAPAFVNSPGPVCDSATLSNASILPDPSHLSYLWSNGATANNTNYLPGNHYVIITDTFSCTDTTTFNIGSFNHISVNLGNDTIMCPDTILTLDAGPGYISYDWGNSSTGRTQLVVTGDTFHVEVLDVNGCTSADTIIITMPTDCVFPGDANQDGIANNSDILALGVAFGEQGPRRPAASSQWYGQACPNWANGFLNGPNYKHADCNSDSIVNQDDTLAVLLNYGQMHNKTSHTNASGVDINVVADFDSVMAGDTAIFIVQMADSLAPADSIYGIAFTVNYDTATVDSQGMLYADFSNCWMG
ncbi:MAG TPA: hypothetical protein ENJ82_08610, partial [Bacteroidetes bacterium]|nr:hypothetical protein [Bacteroidota bacterium]